MTSEEILTRVRSVLESVVTPEDQITPLVLAEVKEAATAELCKIYKEYPLATGLFRTSVEQEGDEICIDVSPIVLDVIKQIDCDFDPIYEGLELVGHEPKSTTYMFVDGGTIKLGHRGKEFFVWIVKQVTESALNRGLLYVGPDRQIMVNHAWKHRENEKELKKAIDDIMKKPLDPISSTQEYRRLQEYMLDPLAFAEKEVQKARDQQTLKELTRGYALALADAICEIGMSAEDAASVATCAGMTAEEMESIWAEGEPVRNILQPVIDQLRAREDEDNE